MARGEQEPVTGEPVRSMVGCTVWDGIGWACRVHSNRKPHGQALDSSSGARLCISAPLAYHPMCDQKKPQITGLCASSLVSAVLHGTPTQNGRGVWAEWHTPGHPWVYFRGKAGAVILFRHTSHIRTVGLESPDCRHRGSEKTRLSRSVWRHVLHVFSSVVLSPFTCGGAGAARPTRAALFGTQSTPGWQATAARGGSS